ncbi:hypothetical protein BY996DRAFT_6421433 [Phakopsora pachyrhizi]|nr:hypothetical protein BY996DRAFT_6421433 [Phakopsora pachyrhizi]
MLFWHAVETSAREKSIIKKEIVHFITSNNWHRQADLPSFNGTIQFLVCKLLKAGKDSLSIPGAGETSVSPNLLRIVRPPLFSQATNIAANYGSEPSDSNILLTGFAPTSNKC